MFIAVYNFAKFSVWAHIHHVECLTWEIMFLIVWPCLRMKLRKNSVVSSLHQTKTSLNLLAEKFECCQSL